jgi:hypothetical protein
MIRFDGDTPCHDGEILDCCATYGIADFAYDGSEVSGEHESYSARGTDYRDKLLTSLHKHIKYAREQNKSLVVCITNSEQMIASSVLRKFGFKSSLWIPRPTNRGPKTKVKLWHYQVK